MLIELDVPQLSVSGIEFSYNCFEYTYSLQSSSTHYPISSSFDATALNMYNMSKGYNTTFDLSRVLVAYSTNSTDLVVPNDYFNRVYSLVLSNNADLKRIEIGDDCFESVRVFELDGLKELEIVVIGKSSFRISDYNERTDGSCRIVNCPKLKSIQIGGYSFSDYYSFELSNLPSLHSIDIGENCFRYAPSFSLTGLID